MFGRSIALTVGLIGALSGQGADWPQYRGPSGDGSSPESIRLNWSEEPPVELWRRSIGPALCSISVMGNGLYTQAKREVNGQQREFCVALDADSGAERWSRELGEARYDNLVGYDDSMDGPRTTPSTDGEHVFVLSSYMRLYCFRADDGEQVWVRDFHAELGSTIIPWQNAASPLLVGDWVLINSNAQGGNRLMAVNKADGTTQWRRESDRMTHATPIHVTLDGVEQVVFLTRDGLVSVVPGTGDVLWRMPFNPSSTSTASTPIFSGPYVYASSSYSRGTWIGRIEREGGEFTAQEIHRERGNNFQSHWASPVEHEGFLYALPGPRSSQVQLVCLDPAAGVNRWEQRVVGSEAVGYGSVLKVVNRLVVLTEGGELVLVEPNPDRYVELAKFPILDRYCWNNAVLANGRLYARNTNPANAEIVAFDVSLPTLPSPLPALRLDVVRGMGGLDWSIIVRAVDGSALAASDADRLELLSTTALPDGNERWMPEVATFEAVDGGLAAELNIRDGEPERYLQVRVEGNEP